jgi:hypothetical protein
MRCSCKPFSKGSRRQSIRSCKPSGTWRSRFQNRLPFIIDRYQSLGAAGNAFQSYPARILRTVQIQGYEYLQRIGASVGGFEAVDDAPDFTPLLQDLQRGPTTLPMAGSHSRLSTWWQRCPQHCWQAQQHSVRPAAVPRPASYRRSQLLQPRREHGHRRGMSIPHPTTTSLG